MRPVCIVDTSVVVSAVLTSDPAAPTAVILRGMLTGQIRFVVSIDLLAEYRTVLLRPRIRARCLLDDSAIARLLGEFAANGLLREPAEGPTAPDPGDQHLWDLLAAAPDACLVTGDRALLESPPAGASVLGPAAYLALDWQL